MMTDLSATTARWGRLKTWMMIAIIALYLILLIPMFAVAPYNLPFGDDMLFSATVGQAYERTGSVLAALREAWNVFLRYYESWQGTYSAILLMALQPGVFGVQYYAMTPFLMIGALTLASLFLARTVSKKLLCADAKSYLICTFLILLFSVQFPSSPREGFYWYNGAVYYTFFHSLFLCLTALLILFAKAAGSGARIGYGALIVLLAGIIAGGNYATALPCGILLFLNVLLWVLPGRGAGWDRRVRCAGRAVSILALLVFCAGMLVSVSAPGNAVRQASVDLTYRSMSAPVAIAVSFPLAFTAILHRMDIGAVLLIGLLLLLFPPYLQKTGFSFRRPGFAVLLAFGLYASQFTPTLYAASSPGPPRLRNLELFNFYWLVCFATLYLAGAAIRSRERADHEEKGPSCRERTLSYLVKRPFFTLLIAGCLVGSMFLQWDLTKTPSYLSATELFSGVAVTHGEHRRNQLLPEELRTTPPPDAAPIPSSGILS